MRITCDVKKNIKFNSVLVEVLLRKRFQSQYIFLFIEKDYFMI